MMDALSRYVFGPKPGDSLPARVREAIEAQRKRGEALICWTQLLVAVLFGVLYALAPKTGTSGAFEPVPVFLLLYIGFTVTRLGLATRDLMPRWMVAVSVAVDMGLLLLLIWSFHLQYAQPPGFSLKAPTMLYIFILIGMRALAFEPRIVLLAGTVAAVGWLGIVAYAIMTGGDGAITRDYVTYVMSDKILIGAEVDKIIAIMLATMVLTVALVRARRFLIRAIAEEAQARDLSRFIAPEIAKQITSADREIQAGEGETRDATIMFTDIAGFTAISEQLRPQQIIDMLNEYFEDVTVPVIENKGVINQFRGDAMLVTFNAPNDDPDHAIHAVRAAAAIQERVAARRYGPNLRLETRCGINTGLIVSGTIGAASRLDFTLHGDIVNTAARLEQLNKEYGTQILLGEGTMQAVHARVGAESAPVFQRIDEVQVKGKVEPVTIYTLATGPLGEADTG